MKEGRKPEYPEKTPDNELQKMPHTTTRKFKPQARLKPTLKHWWQARKADVLTVTPRVAPACLHELYVTASRSDERFMDASNAMKCTRAPYCVAYLYEIKFLAPVAKNLTS